MMLQQSKKQISFVQVNFQQGPKELNSYYLPYSIGCIWSYANSFKYIQDNFQLDHIIWKRDNIDEVATKLATQDVVCFSCYVWNKKYSYNLAKKIKELNPSSIIIFGGPEPAITNPLIFKRHPYIDIIVIREGEVIFKELLLNLTNPLSIKGLLINKDLKAVNTGNPDRIDDLSELPSPYLTGFFDDLVKQNPDVEWNSTLETNRGCPYACTFCDWGSLTYNKVKNLNLDRIYAELEWMGKNKCGYMSVTDANFGMFVERDNMIVDKFIEIQKKYGHPYTFNVSWAKNQKQEVVNIVHKLVNKSSGFNHGLSLSFQTLNEVVLGNIKRKNLQEHNVKKIFQIAEEKNIPITSEMILGLPGETLESWKENFWHLFRIDCHNGIDIFLAQSLENTELNLIQKSQYKIKTSTVYDYMSGSYNDGPLTEGVDIVIETNSIPFDKMIDAQVFNWFINGFHINGFSNFVSRFMYKYKQVDYKTFYEGLFDYLLANSDWFKKEFEEFKFYTVNWTKNGKIDHPGINGIQIYGWNLIHLLVIKIHNNENHDYVLSLVRNYVTETYNLDHTIIDQLFKLQENQTTRYSRLNKYPRIIEFDLNIYDYITSSQEIEKSKTQLIFSYIDKKDISLQKYLEMIYFSRRRGFGKCQITKKNDY